MSSPVLVSIQVGKPVRRGLKDAEDPMERAWYSGIYKEPVEGAIYLGRTNLMGDGQADKRFHGGLNRAVLVYSADHYPLWREELDRMDLAPGMFGENFTISGLSEENVCMGDVYAVGEAEVQVSQLRAPCWKLARRLGRRDIVERVLLNGRSGWYLRVMQEGHVEPGQPFKMVSRLYEAPTLLELHRQKYQSG